MRCWRERLGLGRSAGGEAAEHVLEVLAGLGEGIGVDLAHRGLTRGSVRACGLGGWRAGPVVPGVREECACFSGPVGRLVAMMKTTIALLLLAGVAGAADNMKAFPPPEKGMTRHVLNLEKKADEDSLKVEIIVGKTVKVDAVNRHFFGGRIEEETIEGWGFTRYVVKELGPMAGTLMAPPPGAPLVERFVAIRGNPFLIRYNSRLPVVVYVPEGCEVRCRVWRADPESTKVERG